MAMIFNVQAKSQCDMQRDFMQYGDMFKANAADGVRLAVSLIDEEVNKELLTEVVYLLTALDKTQELQNVGKLPNPEDLQELVERLTIVADGIVDSVYVLFQLANTLHLPFDALFAEVHRSNMSKFHRLEDGTIKAIKREDGKILKPESYSPPDLKSIIVRELFAPIVAATEAANARSPQEATQNQNVGSTQS